MRAYSGTTVRRVLGIAATVVGLFAVPNLASADEVFSLTGVAKIPGNPLLSFDISWFDANPAVRTYYLADRSNKSIDVIGISETPPVFQIIPAAPNAFAGTPGVAFPCKTGAGPNDCVGPNGVITFQNAASGLFELWAGDGPTTNSSCVTGQPFCSTVKVFGGNDAHFITAINTGGAARADELCVDPVHHVVLVANDAESPWPFVSFINTDTKTLVAHLIFDGTSTNGGTLAAPKATNGIEQCQFRAADGNFYINIPEVGTAPGTPGDDSVGGAVVVLSPTAHTVLRIMSVNVALCAGPQGMAIGPNPQILLGCNAPSTVGTGTLNGPQNAAIINADTGGITTLLDDQGGNDQVWFEPGSGHYFLAEGSHLPSEQLGVVDSTTTTGPKVDMQALNKEQLVQFPTSTGNPVNQQAIFVGFAGSTTRRSHSVAAWSGTVSPGPGAVTLALLPVPPVGGTPAAFSSVLCDPIETQGCVAFFLSTQITEEVGE